MYFVSVLNQGAKVRFFIEIITLDAAYLEK